MEKSLEKLSDEQLAARIASYIKTLKSIQVRAEYYVGAVCPEKEREEIANDYIKARDAIRADAEYLNYSRDKQGSSLLWGKYFPSITQAAAWGLYAEPGEAFDKEFLKSVAEAENRLIKYYSYDYWRIIAQG